MDIIKTAIKQHEVLSFNYRNKERIVSPYALGTDKKGKALLLSYQQKPKAEWQLIRVDDIKSAKSTSIKFGPMISKSRRTGLASLVGSFTASHSHSF